MARKITRTTLFSSQWAELIDAVANNGLTIEVPCDTEKEAESYRLRFYSYRKALRADPETNAQANVADSVIATVRIYAGKASTIFAPRDGTKEALAIAEAIRRATSGESSST